MSSSAGSDKATILGSLIGKGSMRAKIAQGIERADRFLLSSHGRACAAGFATNLKGPRRVLGEDRNRAMNYRTREMSARESFLKMFNKSFIFLWGHSSFQSTCVMFASFRNRRSSKHEGNQILSVWLSVKKVMLATILEIGK
jgi:hypothetical protein